jgi:hypothetical protein
MTIYKFLEKNQRLVKQPTDDYLSVSGFKEFVENLLEGEIKIGTNWTDSRRTIPKKFMDKFAESMVIPKYILEYAIIDKDDDHIRSEIEKYREKKENIKRWREFGVSDFKLYEDALTLKSSGDFYGAIGKFYEMSYKNYKVIYYIGECYFRENDFKKVDEIFSKLLLEEIEDRKILESIRATLEYIRSRNI